MNEDYINVEWLDYLADLAKRSPAGMGYEPLANNPESHYAPYPRFLYLIVRGWKPVCVVECGVYLGTTTEHLAIASKDTLVIGIDKEIRPSAVMAANRHENIVLIAGDTVSSAALVEAELYERKIQGIGLLFLDSEHNGFTSQREFAAYKPMLTDPAIIVCDDILDPRMTEFWATMPGEKIERHWLHPKLNANYPEPGFGIIIYRR